MHFGRVSRPGATYFVTFVTAKREPWLRPPATTTGMFDSLHVWHAEGDGRVLAATVMPDHVHVLFELGSRLDVGRCVGRWKSMARRSSQFRGHWQRDFWEHRLRESDNQEDYALYVFLNPYRAGLLGSTETWPGLLLPDSNRFRFPGMLGANGEPPSEWIDWPDDRFEGLQIGE